LLEIVAKSGKPLSAQLDGLPKTVTTPEIRVDCSDETKFKVIAWATEEFKKTHEVIDIDGARVLFGGGWGLVRASNTQPVLVMRFEATTPELLAQYQHEVEQVIERAKAATA
jgi:phosphomannomutase/phosphoglucomutase